MAIDPGSNDAAGSGYSLEPDSSHESGAAARPGQPPAGSFPAPGAEALPGADGANEPIAFDAFCRRCGYQLRGLARTGACPECGTPVAQSLMGDRLAFSSPEYVKTLLTGTRLVLTSILVMIGCGALAMLIGGIAAAGAMGGGGAGGAGSAATLGGFALGTVLIQLVGLAANIASIVGIWLFSTPDPALAGNDTGSKARIVLRATMVFNACMLVVSFVLGALGVTGQGAAAGLFGPGPGATAVWNSAMILGVLLSLLGVVAATVSYFAQMLYVRWLAARIPNQWVIDRAKLLMWLGPLLYTVGALCLMLGPLVALVLYWNMLDRVRKDLKGIVAAQLN